jgi:hypothetical protein
MPLGKVPGRTHYLDEMAPAALDRVERDALERLAGLRDDVADVEAQLEMIKLARAEQQHRSSSKR